MNSFLETKWHTLEPAEIFKILGSREHGLSDAEVKERLIKYGLNKLPTVKPESGLIIFLRQFQSPLIYMLLGAAVVVFLMGEVVDSIVIAAVLILNSIVGSIQEGRARNTLLALRQFVETKAIVLRENKELMISDTELVPGDIVLLKEGEKVPADLRIITARSLKIDEAALTGESEAIYKTNEVLINPNLEVIEEKNMAFKGTNIVSGHGLAIVIQTGLETVIGKIAKEVSTIETEIPLKTNIRNFSRLIIGITLGSSALLFIFGILYGNPADEMLATVISIAVSIIPEGLPIAITIILAAGVWRMSKRNALVKRLQAVEALGQAQVIAVDKTGTLTRNEMVVQALYTDNKLFEVDGIGYVPKGNIKIDNQEIDYSSYQELLLMGKIATLGGNNRPMFVEKTKEWKISGDPTEAAIFVLSQKLGFDKDALEQKLAFLSEIPFDYELKYHASVYKDDGKNFLAIAGAPEVILKNSNKIWHTGEAIHLSPEEREKLTKTFHQISTKGLRVLALAYSHDMPEKIEPSDIKNLTFAGFIGLKDALRLEVKEATRRAREAGIKVVMITGDHKTTAEAIAKEAGIYRTGDMSLTGEDMDKLSDKELVAKLANISVFARVTPEHKFRIIGAYKSNGQTVAMTGDGVNDAPSLVAADLGVAMGIVGTEVAKEASDIVLLDDNFGSIISAVEEGRNIYKTIRKVVLYLLSTGIGEFSVIVGAVFLGLPLPLLPVQIIWLNFVTDGFFTVALAMEPKEKGLLKQTFVKPKKYLVDASMGRRMVLMALPMMIVTLILFQNYLSGDIAKAWTMALTILAVFQWFNAWNCRSEKETVFQKDIYKNMYLVGATVLAAIVQLLAIYHPLFQKFLRTVPLSLSEWIVIITLSTSVIFVEEIRKLFARRKHRKAEGLKPALI